MSRRCSGLLILGCALLGFSAYLLFCLVVLGILFIACLVCMVILSETVILALVVFVVAMILLLVMMGIAFFGGFMFYLGYAYLVEWYFSCVLGEAPSDLIWWGGPGTEDN